MRKSFPTVTRRFHLPPKKHCNLRQFFVQNRDVANVLFLSIYHQVSQYTGSQYACHFNFIHTIRKVRKNLPAVILAEDTRAQQHYMQVSSRDFHQNPTINGSSSTPVSQVFMAFALNNHEIHSISVAVSSTESSNSN